MANNSIIPMFVIFFVLAFGLTIGLSGTPLGQESLEEQFLQKFDSDFQDETPTSWYNLIFDQLLSVETAFGIITGAAIGYLLGGGVAGYIIVGIVLGGAIGYIFNYLAIFNLFIRAMPLEINIFFVGLFSLIIIGFFIKIMVTR